MSLFVMKLVLLLVLIFTTLISSSEAKTTIIIRNDISGEKVRIHCYSVHDDLGFHKLVFKQTFTFRFNRDFFQTTTFYCDFQTNHGFGNYVTYSDSIYAKCYVEDSCVWSIRVSGPCLLYYNNNLYCSPWKNSTQSLPARSFTKRVGHWFKLILTIEILFLYKCSLILAPDCNLMLFFA